MSAVQQALIDIPTPEIRRPVYPSCPICQGETTPKLVMPLVTPRDHDEITYGCQTCGAETKRVEDRK